MRPSQLKKGGGFLDGVDGTWVNYQFTDAYNGEAFAPGKIKYTDDKGKPATMDKPHTLNLSIEFLVDGAEESVTTTLKLANEFDNYTVSEDGRVLSMAGVTDDGDPLDVDINQNTAGGKFLKSLEQSGFPVDELDEDPKSLDLSPCLDRRYRLVQKVDEERTKKYGLKKNKKSGKAYERKDLLIDQYYAEEVAAAPAKTAKSVTGKPVAKPAPGKPAGKAAKGPSLEDLAEEQIVAILKENAIDDEGNPTAFAQSKFSVKILNAMGKHPQREDVRKLCFDKGFMGDDARPWEFDAAKKTVTLKAEDATE